jgi:hypothetical protein
MPWHGQDLPLSSKGGYATYLRKLEHDNCQVGICAGDGQSDMVGGGAHLGCSMLLDGCHGRDPETDPLPTMRMSMRRFTRLTNAFSKKVENHAAAIAVYFMYYNFGRVHQTLRVTPAMKAGVSTHVWSVEEIVSLLN